MKNRLMKVLALGLVFTMGTGLLAGCQSSTDKADNTDNQKQEKEEETADSDEKEEEQAAASSDVTLEVEVNYTGENLDAYRELVDDFTAETGINVNLITPGDDYETVMKTRMASGDMPDVFVTHGWSINRYIEYLEPLTNEEWYGIIEDSILPIISDESGDIYVLPVTQDGNAFTYNATVLENAGVKVEEILTMDDFMEACEKIKATGVTPIYLGGKSNWLFGSIYNTLAGGYFETEGAVCPEGDALKDGTFDWDAYGSYLLEDVAEMIQKGYFNEDYLTADFDAAAKAIGNGECGFIICGGMGVNVTAKNYVEGADVKFMPVPATTDGGKLCYAVGEGSAFGIWKDTEVMDEAKAFLNYMATSEAAIRIMQLDGMMPALTNMADGNSESYNVFKESQSIFEGQIYYDNIFDREYMPNGMWNVMADAITEVFMDPTDEGVETARVLLKDNFAEKYAAAAE